MFGDHGFGMGWTMIFWPLIWLVVIVVVVWVAARAIGGRSRVGSGSLRDDSPEAILKRRYARGEIDREEYDRRLSDVRR